MDLKAEIRCEFLVSEERKAIWVSQMAMLKKMSEVCEKYNIQFFAVAGTMLGAVRHKGFIPWDDDVDIGLLRKDFDKLLEVGPKEFKEPFFFQTAINERDYFSSLVRLRDSRTTAIVNSGSHDDRQRRCNNGIYIDIFPFDSLTENILARKIQFFEIRAISKIMRERVYQESDSKKDRFFHRMSSGISQPLLEKLYKHLCKICAQFNGNKKIKKLAMLQGSVYNQAYYWYKEDLENVIWVDFEDIKIPIPIGYDRCLRIQYGDYMKLPPVEERGKHHEQTVIFDPFTDYLSYQKEHGFLK